MTARGGTRRHVLSLREHERVRGGMRERRPSSAQTPVLHPVPVALESRAHSAGDSAPRSLLHALLAHSIIHPSSCILLSLPLPLFSRHHLQPNVYPRSLYPLSLSLFARCSAHLHY